MCLILARTSYFAILDHSWGLLVCPLIEIGLRNKHKRKDRDVLNLTIPEFTKLGHILSFPGQVKQKTLFFGRSNFWKVTFELIKIEKTRNTIVFLSSRRIETCTVCLKSIARSIAARTGGFRNFWWGKGMGHRGPGECVCGGGSSSGEE